MQTARDRTLLLTGATGFLGASLLPRLLRHGYQVVVAKRSFSNTARIADHLHHISTFDVDRLPLSRIFEERAIDVILHCATNYGRRAVPASVVTDANLMLPLQLLQLAAQHRVKAFVNTDTILDKRINYYTLSKRQFAEWMALFSGQLACINVALEHFFGGSDDPSKFVTSIVLDLLQDVPKIDLTPGEQRRDFIHIDDVVDAFDLVVRHAFEVGVGEHAFEVGCGTNISIKEFVVLVQQIVGNTKTQLRFGELPYRVGEVMASSARTESLRGLGWQPRVTLRDGLVDMVAHERSRL